MTQNGSKSENQKVKRSIRFGQLRRHASPPMKQLASCSAPTSQTLEEQKSCPVKVAQCPCLGHHNQTCACMVLYVPINMYDLQYIYIYDMHVCAQVLQVLYVLIHGHTSSTRKTTSGNLTQEPREHPKLADMLSQGHLHKQGSIFILHLNIAL